LAKQGNEKFETRRVKRIIGGVERVFYEEILDVKLVVFDEVLEHILRIDRVSRQSMGHLLQCGDANAGKTVLTKICQVRLGGGGMCCT
jgi:dynein heavy chain 1